MHASVNDVKEDSNSFQTAAKNPQKYFPPGPSPVLSASPSGAYEDIFDPYKAMGYMSDMKEDIKHSLSGSSSGDVA